MKAKKESESRDLLSEDARAATAMGLTYGKYKALTYKPTPYTPTEEKRLISPQKKHKPKKYTDEAIFTLWQQGLPDTKIAEKFGVTKQTIQKWRDIMEVPSIPQPERQKYRLVDTEYGLYVLSPDDEI